MGAVPQITQIPQSVLFSYLCLVEEWLSIASERHLLVSHMEAFSPRVVMPMWEVKKALLNISDWKGNTTLWSV